MTGHDAFRRLSRPSRAFTLIELVTAASLMTVMMLGVVQIFAMITEAAGEAEGLHSAQAQQRALFDMLHRDFDGLTHEGYLRIIKNPTNITDVKTYAGDVLAMTTVGAFTGAWGPTGNPAAYKGTAAEVVYTTNVRTPDNVLKVVVPTSTVTVDQRKGILGRGVWIFSGSVPASDLNLDDRTKVETLAKLAANPAQRVIQDPKLMFSVGLASVVGPQVWPVSTVSGSSVNPQSLRRVMTTCTSEFYVEVLDYDSTAGKYTWVPGGSTYLTPKDNATMDWKPGITDPRWPKAVRITVATHAPDDRLPPATPAAPGYERFQGYAMQEVFWIRDP
jgi:Tfp pilus assembly protein PilW